MRALACHRSPAAPLPRMPLSTRARAESQRPWPGGQLQQRLVRLRQGASRLAGPRATISLTHARMRRAAQLKKSGPALAYAQKAFALSERLVGRDNPQTAQVVRSCSEAAARTCLPPPGPRRP
jgi:hypothetical protein